MESGRVIHIVDTLDRGSVETWLLQMLAHARRRGQALDWTFYCTIPGEAPKDPLARELGARVIYSPAPLADQLRFTGALRGELKSGGYEVLHAHEDLVSGVHLAAAVGLPIRRRIVHVHNADETVPTPSRLKQALLRPVLRRTCLTLADLVVGNSSHSLDTFLGGRRRRPGRDLVHYLGIEPTPFASAAGDRAGLRRRLRLKQDSPIMLFFGRMTPEKNPVYAVEVLAAVRRLRPDVAGVFAGDGSLEPEARRRAAELGLDGSIRFLGWSDEAPEIMSACDLFILPHPEHPMEGFGVAVVEAQLAGLRLLLSRGVADDPLLPNAMVRRLPLDAGPDAWAEAAIELLGMPATPRAEALAALQTSPMDMDRALDELMSLHGAPAPRG